MYGFLKEILNINRQNKLIITIKIIVVIFFMKVKLFDESHELDLEKNINKFLKEKDIDLIDIKYQVAISDFTEDQIYCFSALIMYKEKE